jgi:hypothetical protein
VGFVLWRVVHRYVREVDRALIDYDLTHLQFTTLAMMAWLEREGDAVTQAEISTNRRDQAHWLHKVSHAANTIALFLSAVDSPMPISVSVASLSL